MYIHALDYVLYIHLSNPRDISDSTCSHPARVNVLSTPSAMCTNPNGFYQRIKHDSIRPPTSASIYSDTAASHYPIESRNELSSLSTTQHRHSVVAIQRSRMQQYHSLWECASWPPVFAVSTQHQERLLPSRRNISKHNFASNEHYVDYLSSPQRIVDQELDKNLKQSSASERKIATITC